MHTQRSTVVGVFHSRSDAQRCVDELKRAGFRDDQIGVAGRDMDKSSTSATGGETYAEEGAVTGAVAGAGVGALWALGIAAGVLPAIGPVIAGGTLAAILASAAGGAAAGTLVGSLIGLGIPEDEAQYYESEFHSGRTIVTVKAENRYDEAWNLIRRFNGYDMQNRNLAASSSTAHTEHLHTNVAKPETVANESHMASHTHTTPAASHTHTAATSASTAATGKVQLREEELRVHKTPVETGEVHVRKEVHTEHKTLEVPVQREEVVIERRPVSGSTPATGDIGASQDIRIPVREEQVHIEKTPVVKEEVSIGKRKVTDTEQVSGTVRKEEVRIEKEGNVDVRHDSTRSNKNKK